MEKESQGRRAATSIGNSEYPPKDHLCHPKGLWVGDKEENESGIKGIFGFEGEIYGCGICWFIAHSI